MDKILFVISNFSIGGAQRITLTLSRWLVQNQKAVCVVALSASENNYQLIDGIKFVCLGQRSSKEFARTIKSLRSVIKDEKPDIVITMGVSTSIYTVLAMPGIKSKHIISERNDPRHFLGRPIVKKISQSLIGFADGYVFQTQEASEYYPVSIQKKGTVIPNPLMAKELPCAAGSEKEKMIVTMGRLTAQKNHRLLIDAFAAFSKDHPDYKLCIFGSGELKQQTAEYIASLNLEDEIILHEACNDVLERISSAEMFVLSSDFEGMPNALMEAMAMGLPCISTDCPCGGPRYLIQHGYNGLLIPVGNRNALTEAMVELADNRDLRDSIAVNAKEIKERLSTEKICHLWYQYCEGVSKK